MAAGNYSTLNMFITNASVLLIFQYYSGTVHSTNTVVHIMLEINNWSKVAVNNTTILIIFSYNTLMLDLREYQSFCRAMGNNMFKPGLPDLVLLEMAIHQLKWKVHQMITEKPA